MLKNFGCITIAGTVALSGCGYRHGDMALDGKLRIELSPSNGSCFNGIFVEERASHLLVSGFGHRPAHYGNIEVSLIASDGAALATTRVPLLPPLPVPKRSYDYRFEAILPVVPSEPSTLRVTFLAKSSQALLSIAPTFLCRR